MTSGYIDRRNLEHLLAGLMPPNREALRLSMDYGMRIGDVLAMPSSAPDKPRYTYTEEKTGKKRTVRLSEAHRASLRALRNDYWCFPHRLDPRRHRCRQTVWKDLKRIAKAFRLKAISPHSARKLFAVELYHRTGDMKRVQRALNHDNVEVTALYALADQLTFSGSSTHMKRRRTD